MTLIVGNITGGRIQLLADTRISHPDVTQVEEVPGRLKLIVVRPDLCVGFAGSADYAMDAIRGIASNHPSSLEIVLSRLVAVNDESDGSVDFMVASIHPTPHLVVIRNHHVEDVLLEDWIGDADAAAEYRVQKRAGAIVPSESHQGAMEAKTRDLADSQMFSTAISAFGKVVREERVKSVGGLVIRVGLRHLGFCYLPEAHSYFPSQTIPHGIPTALSFDGSAQGGFAYSLLVPLEDGRLEAGRAVVGVHFFQGRLGFVYAPLLHDRPIQIPNVSHDELRQCVLDRFDLMIDGIRLG